MNTLTDLTVKLGNFILYILKLHAIAILHIFKGGILLGLFPTLATIWDLLFINYQTKEYPSLTPFSNKWHEYFKAANIIGYCLTALLSVIAYEIFLTLKVLHWPWLSLFLLMILILLGGIFIYSFPSLVRYDLSIKNHFKQAFFLLLCSIPELIAAVIGFSLVIALLTLLPILAIFASIPLLIYPLAWFSYQAITHLEKNQTNGGA